MHFLSHKIEFPDISEASADGLLAIGGDLSPERILHGYTKGIFPWYQDEEPILWWSPDPRFVLFPEDLKVSKSMKQILRKGLFEVTENKDFKAVIENCAEVKREGQQGTWITDEMIEAYLKLHDMGFAKSVEVWQNDKLVGGLYGISFNDSLFCGESMFAKVSNASKVGFISFVQNSNYKLIDCQLHTRHLESLGAKSMPRSEFQNYL
ncbi:leucyl/phenylalanyl-tRNA--protein transferase [Winogradskyella epiphytica]|uniref:Leucyl/phenylalanyl-tRNA--protein transferase n=1 Tax=Winogradskyella epiphytica TaxID=262005 RepID=A0A2V4X044_9FLAO|nr:leucyl/phenylalanyl-tRNA--protein transferase [Winogradskyella epiphytica]PYE83048.1 leucyl/phenylalanyl-tRNA--protein transferase [Winogradskyella epiphytica]GGW55422.1 leucyl/phenylalanyl-tRNA--protein transferase [Winogradskyella epiphytica]